MGKHKRAVAHLQIFEPVQIFILAYFHAANVDPAGPALDFPKFVPLRKNVANVYEWVHILNNGALFV